MPEHQSNTTPDSGSATAEDTSLRASEAPLEGISVSEPEDALPRVNLEDLPEDMRAACLRAGWQGLMPVQSLALPYLLEGRDIMVQSRTGSGKTGCYLLPMLPRLSAELKAPQALVLAPTRELAVQVEREAAVLFEGTGIVTVAVYGGVGYKKQMDALRNGAQLIVGTPGRVLDHLLRRTLDLVDLRELVFDEADSLFSKRVEVKQANDRFANMEVNVLLQLIERYDGLVMLTTNLKTSLDPALERRLSFKVNFPFPDAEMRATIWESLIPDSAPLAPNVDFGLLGSCFELSGGSVKNAVLRAAYRAAAQNVPLDMDLFEDAARRECQAAGKLFRTIPKDDRW